MNNIIIINSERLSLTCEGCKYSAQCKIDEKNQKNCICNHSDCKNYSK